MAGNNCCGSRSIDRTMIELSRANSALRPMIDAAFRAIKANLDPGKPMNPSKIIDPQEILAREAQAGRLRPSLKPARQKMLASDRRRRRPRSAACGAVAGRSLDGLTQRGRMVGWTPP